MTAAERAESCSCGGNAYVCRGVGKWYRVTCVTCGRRAQRASRSAESATRLWNVERRADRSGKGRAR